MGRGAISQQGNLFLVTKLESRKQSEEPESTSPLKVNGDGGDKSKIDISGMSFYQKQG